MNTLRLYQLLVYLYMNNDKVNCSLCEWFGTDQETLELFLQNQTKVIFTVHHNPAERSPSGWTMVKIDDSIKGKSFKQVVVGEFVK